MTQGYWSADEVDLVMCRTSAGVDAATVIFAIGCPLPANASASGKSANWDDVPDDQGYGAQRDAIKKHVESLVEDLLKKQR